jgi:outer membrane protein assembly factor BamB
VGRRRPTVCTACRRDWPEAARWCGRCGAPLATPLAVTPGGAARRAVGARLAAIAGAVAVAAGAALLSVPLGSGASPQVFDAEVDLSPVPVATAADQPAGRGASDGAAPPSARAVCVPVGCEAWRFDADGPIEVAVGPDGDDVLVTSRPSGVVQVLDTRTGEVRWRRDPPVNRQTRLLGDVVVVWTEEELVAYDLDDGAPRWATPSPVVTHRPTYRLLRTSGPGANGGARRLSDGWATPGPDPVGILSGYRGPGSAELVFALDLTNGEVRWTEPDAAAVAVAGDRVVVVRDRPGGDAGGGRSEVAMLDARSGAELWSVTGPDGAVSAAPVDDRYVVLGTAAGQDVRDAATGDRLFRRPAAERGSVRGGGVGWWFAPSGAEVLVEVRPSSEAAELVAYHLDGGDAWRRVLPGPRRAPIPRTTPVELADGDGGRIVVRGGPPGPDALVVELDAATGATRRLSMRMPTDAQAVDVERPTWIVVATPEGLAGYAPGGARPTWRLTGPTPFEVVATDPLLVATPGELLGLAPPA